MRIQPKTLEFQIVEDLSRSKHHDAPPKNMKCLENQEILLNPEMGQKASFGNEYGHEIDRVLAIRRETGSIHTNFFVRIQL